MTKMLLQKVFPLVRKAWMSLACLFGRVMTRIILTILFYFVVTPIALLARATGKDFLNMRFDKQVPSYWIPKAAAADKKSYEQQF